MEDIRILPKPPQIIASLLSGFELIANHIYLVIFPVLLDLFLWFGPHLSVRHLFESLFRQVSAIPEMSTPESAEIIRLNQEVWSAFTEQFNVVSLLRTYPIGVSSLMVSMQSFNTPQGVPYIYEAPSFNLLLIWVLGILLMGVILGTMYFNSISQVVTVGEIQWYHSLTEFISTIFRVIMLSGIWLGILVIITIPVSCLLSIFTIGGLGDLRLGIFIVAGLIVWLFFPLLLSPHGIFLYQKSAWLSIKDSIRLTRFTIPSTTILFLIILLLSEGLNVLWRVAGETSWFTFVGILGHGFITTGLLAATFVYYQDANTWVNKMLEYVKLHPR